MISEVEVVFVEPGMPTDSVAWHLALVALRRAPVHRHLFFMGLVEDEGCSNHELRHLIGLFVGRVVNAFPV
jgi:hypothetical protein